MRAFFFCAEPRWGVGGYQHLSIVLAEGFRELGIEFYSDKDYWEEEPGQYLFRHDPDVSFEDCDLVFINSEWHVMGHPWPPNDLEYPMPVLLSGPNRMVFWLDGMDITVCWDPIFRQFNGVLRVHYNRHMEDLTEHENIAPWAFGVSSRVLRAIGDFVPFAERKRALWSRYRVAHPLRWHMEEYFYPLLERVLPVDHSTDEGYGGFADRPGGEWDALMWEQCGSNHHPLYYNQLKHVQACAAFGGLMADENSHEWQYIDQWDGHRLWESFAAGCATFHVDLERYGCTLPEMPENWVHYVGVDLQDLQGTVDRIAETDLEAIGRAGREWALERYGPVPTALRFLRMIGAVE